MEAGQVVLTGPCSASLTARAFRFSGAMQTIFSLNKAPER